MLWKSPPTYPPLPVEPFFGAIRRTTAFKALNLLFDCYRCTSIQPITGQHVSYFKAVMRHGSVAIRNHLLMGILMFPPTYLITPDHPVWGNKTLLGSCVWTTATAYSMYLGTSMVWHLTALLGVASGMYTDEEYPAAFVSPAKSTSLSELWGKRYHDFMKVSLEMEYR